MKRHFLYINMIRGVLSLLLVLVSGVFTAKPANASNAAINTKFQVTATSSNVCSGKPCYFYQVKVNGIASSWSNKPKNPFAVPKVWVNANTRVKVEFNINGFGWRTCYVYYNTPTNVNVPLWVTIRYTGNGTCRIG
jgi:hypothetical protein